MVFKKYKVIMCENLKENLESIAQLVLPELMISDNFTCVLIDY